MSKLTIIGSDNGLSPGRHQAIIWPNDGILLIWPPGTHFSEMLIEIYTISFKKMHVKMSPEKWRPFCLGLNVLTLRGWETHICARKSGHHWFRERHRTCVYASGSNNGLSPVLTTSTQCQIIWITDDLLLYGPPQTIFSARKLIRNCLLKNRHHFVFALVYLGVG